jgi:dATP pyrophosphohydrolase
VSRTRQVAVLVHRGDEVLVLKRAFGEPYWHVVAGGVREGETGLEAAERELAEETGLRARGGVHALDRRYAYGVGAGEVTVETFAVEAPAAWEPELNEEHSGYRWCSFDAAVELVRWADVRESLRLLEERLPRRRRHLTLRRPRRPAVFFLRFGDPRAAEEVAQVLREDGYSASVAAEPAHWLVEARGLVRQDSFDVAERALSALAKAKGGRYAGCRPEPETTTERAQVRR